MRYQNVKFLALTVLGLQAIAAGVEAAPITLVTYNFDAFNGAPTQSPTGQAAVIASNFTPATLNTTPGNHFVSGYYSDAYDSSSTGETNTVANDQYASVTLTPVSSPVDLASLTFDIAAGGSSGTRTLFLRTSQDNFAATIYTSGDVNSTSFSNVSVDLSALSDLTTAQPLTVRFYIFTGNNSNDLRLDNVSFSGTVVPEPAGALALLGLSALGFRRSRR